MIGFTKKLTLGIFVFFHNEVRRFFIKSILQAISTYTMAYFLLPKSLCVELEGICAKF